MTVAASILRELREAASPEKEAVLRRFCKTGHGEYGEGDRFLGVMVPRIRAIARAHLAFVRASDVRTLLASPLHEARECGLFLLVGQFRSERNLLGDCCTRQGRWKSWKSGPSAVSVST